MTIFRISFLGTLVLMSGLISSCGRDAKVRPSGSSDASGTPSYRVSFDAGLDRSKDSRQFSRDLSVYFVIDVTEDMEFVKSALSNALFQMADNLKSKSYALRVGVVAFSDEVETSFALTSDLNEFKRFLAGVQTVDGGDFHDASLLATSVALDRMHDEEQNSSALRAIVLITDNAGHDGEGGIFSGRNCAIDPLVTKFNELSNEDQLNTKFFHSSSSEETFLGCDGYYSAKKQLNDLMAQTLAVVPLSARGGALPWPLNEGVFIDAFVAQLAEVSPPKDKICLAESATLSSRDEALLEWQSEGREIVAKRIDDGEQIYFDSSLTEEIIADIEKFRLDVSYCCIQTENVTNGSFDTCDEDVSATSEFTITKSGS